MEQLGGLIKTMPVSALLFLGSALSIAAVVPFNGFIGEWLTYQALFENIVAGGRGLDIVAMLSIATLAFAGALALATFVKAFGVSFLGLGRSEHSRNASEVPQIMNVGIGILVVLSLVVGVLPMTLIGLVDKTIVSMTGQSIIGGMTGGFFIGTYPVTIGANSISPLAGALLLLAVSGMTIFLLYITVGKTIERKYGTWDCGFDSLNSRMQYTSSGYSKSLSIILRFLVRPTRSLNQTGETVYHPKEMEYVMGTEPIFEKYLYEPLADFVKGISVKAKHRIQTGSIHAYLIYIFMTVIFLMLYNRLA